MKKWLKIALWSLFAIGVIALVFVANAVQKEKELLAPEITIQTDGEHPFLTKAELIRLLERKGLWRAGMTKEELDIQGVEDVIMGISQVKKAEVFSNIGSTWKIDIELRKPIARIFNKFDETFYLDQDGESMSTTSSYSARVLVVTGEIVDRKNGPSVFEIINNDSLKSIQKLDEIYRISNYVCHDPLLHSLIGQMHVQKNGDFVLIPLVGDLEIVFGTANSEREVAEKFKKLVIFYEEAMPSVGWEKYSEISLKYEDQIVCKTKPTAG